MCFVFVMFQVVRNSWCRCGCVHMEDEQLWDSCFGLQGGGEGEGDWRFCLFSIQKFISHRQWKRVLWRLLLPLTKWHARAVELGSWSRHVSVDLVTATNRFLWWRSKFLFFLKVVREKQHCLVLQLISFAQARQSRQNATQIRSFELVVVAYHTHWHVITLAWEVTNALWAYSYNQVTTQPSCRCPLWKLHNLWHHCTSQQNWKTLLYAPSPAIR